MKQLLMVVVLMILGFVVFDMILGEGISLRAGSAEVMVNTIDYVSSN